MSLRFLLDEHVSPHLQAELLKREPSLSVWRIGEPGAPDTGTPDSRLLEWCEANDFIIVTNNRATMPVHLRDHIARGRHSPGIFILSPSLGLSGTVAELILIAGTTLEGEHQDLISFLPIS